MNRDIDRNEIRVIKFSEQYRAQTIDVLGLIWVKIDYAAREKRFDQRYINNPYLGENFVFIAVYRDEVIGIAPYVVQIFSFAGDPRAMLSAADTVIKPEYQGLGVYAKLAREAMAYVSMNSEKLGFGVYLNLSSNHNSTPACLKIGWKPLQNRSYMHKISLANYLGQPALDERSKTYKNGKYRVELSRQIRSDELTRLAQQNKAPIHNIRDSRYFEWRYKSSKCLFVYCYENSRPVAYLVLNEQTSREYAVLEWGFESIESLVLINRFIVKELRIPKLRLYHLFLTDQEKKALRKSHYWEEPAILQRILKKHRFPALVFLQDSKASAVLINGVDPSDPRNWSISSSDVY